MTFQNNTSPEQISIITEFCFFFFSDYLNYSWNIFKSPLHFSQVLKYFNFFDQMHLNIINYAYHISYFFQQSFPKFGDPLAIFFPILPIQVLFFPNSMAPGPHFKLEGKSLLPLSKVIENTTEYIQNKYKGINLIKTTHQSVSLLTPMRHYMNTI